MEPGVIGERKVAVRMIALFAALKEELSELRKRTNIEETVTRPNYIIDKGTYQNREVLLVQTGPGKERVQAAVQDVLEHYPVNTVVSLGFAGALTDEMKAGDVVLCSTLYATHDWTIRGIAEDEKHFSDSRLVSSLMANFNGSAPWLSQGSCVTSPNPVLYPETKLNLGKTFNAQAVDMESYWVATAASEKNLPFIAVRAVSDTTKERLLPLDNLMGKQGEIQFKQALKYILAHPQHLGKLVALYRNAKQAIKNMSIVVGRLITAYEAGKS